MKAMKNESNIKIQRNFYTMATVDRDSAEIVMYGDIVENKPIDWWTGEPIPGDYIVQSEFLEDLKQVENCKDITIRMNSCGGDAGVSILIHNRLRELVAKGTKLTCIVDGVAMSGGSLIMCACDTVKANPSSLIMIHKCWSFIWGAYNADELRSTADGFDAVDKAQASIYQRKTKLGETVIKHLMADTTYMTGKEAKEKGFVDEVIDDEGALAIAASADRKTIFVAGRKINLNKPLADNISTVAPEAKTLVETNTNMLEEPNEEQGGKPMANNIEELRNEYPDLVAQIEAAAATIAVANERARMQDIDAVASLFSNELVTEAKYGEKPCSAQELTYRAAVEATKQGSAFMKGIIADNQVSGVEEVSATPAPEEKAAPKTKEEKYEEARVAIASVLGKKEEQ